MSSSFHCPALHRILRIPSERFMGLDLALSFCIICSRNSEECAQAGYEFPLQQVHSPQENKIFHESLTYRDIWFETESQIRSYKWRQPEDISGTGVQNHMDKAVERENYSQYRLLAATAVKLHPLHRKHQQGKPEKGKMGNVLVMMAGSVIHEKKVKQIKVRSYGSNHTPESEQIARNRVLLEPPIQ